MMFRCLRSSFAVRRFFCSSNKPANVGLDTLGGRLVRVRNFDSGGAAAVLAKWKEEGRNASKHQIISAVRRLIKRNDYAKAFTIYDSMVKHKVFQLKPTDYAMHLDLISRVCGLHNVEKYFDGIPEEMKDEITWTALLRILVKKGECLKAEALMEKIKKCGFSSNPEVYIHMMSLYSSKEQFDKAEEMNCEVKKCIPPDVHIYNRWLNACGSLENVGGAEKALAQMKETEVEANWLTYATLATMYIKKKLFEKAGAALKEMEDRAPPIDPTSVNIYCSLLRKHGDMGNKDEVMRIWDKLKPNKIGSNLQYGAMVSALLKLNLFEKADEFFEEWQSFPGSSRAHTEPVFRYMLLRKYKKTSSAD